MLKFFDRQGLIVDKVHGMIFFKQSKWLESYISFTTEKRIQATEDFEKDFYKFISNAAFRKTLKNVLDGL